ncbi:MAG: hypothetical protein CMB80_16465 [Flammeovirgaceae bacterium]|nr:hypothetical protein [Flammeovirgaceae bacterium]
MKREELIAQLELLPEGAEVYVRRGKRIAEPLVCFYDVEPYPAPKKLVVYIETFADMLDDRGDDIHESWFEACTKPFHEYLHHVCHHGRDVMGSCGGCTIEEEGDEE